MASASFILGPLSAGMWTLPIIKEPISFDAKRFLKFVSSVGKKEMKLKLQDSKVVMQCGRMRLALFYGKSDLTFNETPNKFYELTEGFKNTLKLSFPFISP